MDVSIFIAKIYSAVFVVFGIALIFNANYYKKVMLDFTKNTAGLMIWGLIALVIGLAIVINHNIWEASWIVIITITGWIALLKGGMMLLLPQVYKMFDPWFQNKGLIIFGGAFALVFGGVLGYFGWFV
jgi:drug/metabolite transporter (DMT)-like permease